MANNLILAISFGFKLNSNLKCNIYLVFYCIELSAFCLVSKFYCTVILLVCSFEVFCIYYFIVIHVVMYCIVIL